MSEVLAYMSGPFFLGFALESFGMGIVLILSINYFMTLASQPKSPHESSRTLGVCLVGISLVLNIVQTIVDLIRGWNMFATNFTNIAGFLTSSPLFFVSPFLGLIQTTITQLFLLRRITLFISSLDLLWPKLAHPLVKNFFALSVGIAILACFVCGTISSVLVWKSGSLISLGLPGNTGFAKAESVWLATSTAVDTLLSLVLSIELWWARQKLGMQGGVMREIVTRLILVTCHGGLAVSGLQLSSLLLYNYWRYNAFCYLPILFLPKVYNITLILSLSVPHSTEIAPNPSHMFSLPTILDTQVPTNEPNRRFTSPLPDHNAATRSRNGIDKQPQHSGQMAERPDKRQWISWSVGAIPSSSSSQIRNRHSISQNRRFQRYSYNERFREERDRRPSDPNSLSPLIPEQSQPQPQPSNPLAYTHESSFLPDHTILPSPSPSSMTAQRHSAIVTPSSSRPLQSSFDVSAIYPQPNSSLFDVDPFHSTTHRNQHHHSPNESSLPQQEDEDETSLKGVLTSGDRDQRRSEGDRPVTFMDILDTGPDSGEYRGNEKDF
ncbi:hypothetical protein I203_105687 [Kwoniella mangroviensis CBS 8507]|uniref:uncharacterized protein n=1 Tax=Kwoniella mangroviensis CBS 8507 TaxID=1296122 RepID=UPI00080CF6FF|nr:uncharacterized protein I203_01499 [Kwoniella mangroviensis CBS 8507]OCF69635.1 hypothetical protein I203_01499 [Kwoniella mangroviensis CBS 8507]